MKVMNGTELNRMPAGTVFALLGPSNPDPKKDCTDPEPGPLTMILTKGDVDDEEFIIRTDDGFVETEEHYGGKGHPFNDEAQKLLNGPLALCWGTNSTGCYDDNQVFAVLDDADVETLIFKLQNRKHIEEVMRGMK